MITPNTHNNLPNIVDKKSTLGKSSVQVSLVLLGTVGLSACDDNNNTRYQYNNRQECVQDWGEDECPKQSSGGSGGGSYYYYRSGYHSSEKNQAKNAKSVSRGGFGSSGRSSS